MDAAALPPESAFSETFRWRPGAIPLGSALIGFVVAVIGAAVMPLPLRMIFLSSWILLFFLFLPVIDSRLRLDELGVTLLQQGRTVWTLTWVELREVRYEPGTPFSKNFDRLLLATDAGVNPLKFDDRLAGRWSDPQRILALLRERGYDVRPR